MNRAKPGANYMSLREYANELGICYKTAWNRYKQRKLKGSWKSAEDGHVYVPTDLLTDKNSNEVVIYVTATSYNEDGTKQMDAQVEIMTKYCNWHGWTVKEVVREVCTDIVSGFRPKFNDLLKRRKVKKIVVYKRADVCFYGFDYIKTLLVGQNRSIYVMDDTNEVTDYDMLMREAVNTIYAMCRVISGDAGVSKVQVKQLINKLIL